MMQKKNLVYAFIIFRLDYCNPLLSGYFSRCKNKQKFVQKTAAARLHCIMTILPFLLLWLPLNFHTDSKILFCLSHHSET